MKAELQFFALPTDAEEVLAFIKDRVDAIKNDSHLNTSRLIIGDCELIYTAATLQGKLLLVGSLAINTGPVNESCADQERAKAVYRKMRNWFKKNYSNKLATHSLEGDRDEGIARNHWISPAAMVWKQEDDGRFLKLYDTSPIAFDIMVISKKIGKLTPVESNKIRGHG